MQRRAADLILIEALSQARFLGPLSQLGPPVVAVRAASLEDVTTGIRLIGQIIGNEEAAEKAAEEIATRVSGALEDATEGHSALILISDAGQEPVRGETTVLSRGDSCNVEAVEPGGGTARQRDVPGFRAGVGGAIVDHGPGLPVHDYAGTGTRAKTLCNAASHTGDLQPAGDHERPVA